MSGTDKPSDTAAPNLPLDKAALDRHLEQRIWERSTLGHLYEIENGDDGPEAYFTDHAAHSIWQAVQDAICEAGWEIVTNAAEKTEAEIERLRTGLLLIKGLGRGRRHIASGKLAEIAHRTLRGDDVDSIRAKLGEADCAVADYAGSITDAE